MLAFSLRGYVRVVGPGSAKGSKHLSSDLLWSTHDSVMHAVWFYSLWECILTSKCSRRSCPRRLLPLIFCVLPYSGNQKRKTHRIWPTLFWGPGPLGVHLWYASEWARRPQQLLLQPASHINQTRRSPQYSASFGSLPSRLTAVNILSPSAVERSGKPPVDRFQN